MILVILVFCHIAGNAYSEDIKAQERRVLVKAIKTALKIKPIPAYQIAEISRYLEGAFGEQSKPIYERLFERLRKSAANANSADEYTNVSTAANRLLRSVDIASPKLAQKLFESWPSPPELENQFNDFTKQFEADRQVNRLLKNPMSYVNENIPVQNTNAWLALFSRFFSRPADARQAFDRLLTASENQQRYHPAEFIGFWLEPACWDASLFRHYVAYLKGSDSTFRDYSLSCDDRTTTISYSDGEALRVLLRMFPSHPDLAAELMQSVSGLKEKADLVGGIQAISERGVIRWNTANGSIVYKGHKGFDKKIADLCEESKRNPDEVRQSLAASKSAKDFEFLSRAASASCPDVAKASSEFARELTLSEPDTQTRIRMAIQLWPYDPDGTHLEPEWVQFGFEISRRAGLPTQNSEQTEFQERFISRLAIADFNRAMSYEKRAETPLARLQIMLAVIKGLDLESWRATESKSHIK